MRLFAVILLTMLTCNWCNGLRILGVFPLNGKSHWVMGEALLTGLAKRGHRVDAITHFPLKNPPPNYKDISLEGSVPPAVNNMNATNITRIDTRDLKFLIHWTGDKMCELLGHPKLQELIKNPPKDPPYDLVIVEIFFASCYMAFGRYLNVPVVGVITSNFYEWLDEVTGYPYNPAFMPGLFMPFGQRMTFWERVKNTVLTNLISRKIHYYMGQQSSYVKEHFKLNNEIQEFYADMGLVLVNMHHSLHGVNPTTTGVVEVGGLHIKEEADPLTPEVQKWLDESKHGCIFFTFGSMVRIESFPKPLMETFYKVFEKIAPVRVLLKIAKKEELIPGLPKNVMIQPWFSQVAVFKHKNVKAFVTHGGLMSMLEAIYFGIPLIGIPLFGDQTKNLGNAVNKNIAINLGSVDNVTVENLHGAIKTILTDKTYRTSITKLSQLFKDRPMAPLDTAIYWTEYVGRHGNVLISPAVHLTWWQQKLLDVYGFLVASTVIALAVAIFLIRKLKNCLFGCKSCSTKPSHLESKKRK